MRSLDRPGIRPRRGAAMVVGVGLAVGKTADGASETILA
jgi:hypothetical protein